MLFLFNKHTNTDDRAGIELSADNMTHLHRYGVLRVYDSNNNSRTVTLKKITNGEFYCVKLAPDARRVGCMFTSKQLFYVTCYPVTLKSPYFLSKLEMLSPEVYLDLHVTMSSMLDDVCTRIMQNKITCRSMKITISESGHSDVLHSMINTEYIHLENLTINHPHGEVQSYFYTAMKRTWLKMLIIDQLPQVAEISNLTFYYFMLHSQRWLELVLHYYKILPKDLIVYLRPFIFSLPQNVCRAIAQ